MRLTVMAGAECNDILDRVGALKREPEYVVRLKIVPAIFQLKLFFSAIFAPTSCSLYYMVPDPVVTKIALHLQLDAVWVFDSCGRRANIIECAPLR